MPKAKAKTSIDADTSNKIRRARSKSIPNKSRNIIPATATIVRHRTRWLVAPDGTRHKVRVPVYGTPQVSREYLDKAGE